MSTRHRSSIVLLFLFLSILLAMLVSACGGSTGSTSNGTNGSSSTTATKDVSIGLGYIPDIQFAPFYVAQSKGYYKAAGLNVTLNHGIVPDLIGSMVAGKNTFVFAGGDELLMARDKKVNAVDVATIFQKYPVSLIVPADSAIKSITDLKGHTIGVPGPYGSTYTGLLALLYKAHLTASDVKIQSIGFTQVSALLNKKVDAVMGYSNNEPLQLQKQGLNVRTFAVSDYQPLISNGLITTTDTYHNQPALVKSFVQATLKGLKDVIANPTAAVQMSQSFVPGMKVDQATTVLQATIPIWQNPNGQLGYNDSASWSSMEQFLVAEKLIAPVPDISQAYTNQSVA